MLFLGSLAFLPLLFTLSFASSEPVYDSNLPPVLAQQMKTDLDFLASLKLLNQSPLHAEVFGPFKSGPYLPWFSARVKSVGASLCGSDNAVACVLSAWENKIWITPNYSRFSHPGIARLSVILHEARHTESNEDFWPHSQCPIPFRDASGNDVKSIWTGALLQGESACDVMALGSYGTQAIFLRNLSLYCSNCTDKVKADADLYGTDILQRITDPETRGKMQKDLGYK